MIFTPLDWLIIAVPFVIVFSVKGSSEGVK